LHKINEFAKPSVLEWSVWKEVSWNEFWSWQWRGRQTRWQRVRAWSVSGSNQKPLQEIGSSVSICTRAVTHSSHRWQSSVLCGLSEGNMWSSTLRNLHLFMDQFVLLLVIEYEFCHV